MCRKAETVNYHQMYLTTINVKHEFLKLKQKAERIRLMVINKQINTSKTKEKQNAKQQCNSSI
jgi:cell division protein ZapA (FtsZ GTPase activity inhibitor)